MGQLRHRIVPKNPRRDGPKKAGLHSWQVLNTSDDYYTWPGDEWGDAKSVQEIPETCVFDYMDEAPSALCELGSGAGRFSEAVFQKYSTAKITCFDVSGEFLEQLNKRFAVERDEARLNTCLIKPDPAQMYQELADASLIEKSIAFTLLTPWCMSSCTLL